MSAISLVFTKPTSAPFFWQGFQMQMLSVSQVAPEAVDSKVVEQVGQWWVFVQDSDARLPVAPVRSRSRWKLHLLQQLLRHHQPSRWGMLGERGEKIVVKMVEERWEVKRERITQIWDTSLAESDINLTYIWHEINMTHPCIPLHQWWEMLHQLWWNPTYSYCLLDTPFDTWSVNLSSAEHQCVTSLTRDLTSSLIILAPSHAL